MIGFPIFARAKLSSVPGCWSSSSIAHAQHRWRQAVDIVYVLIIVGFLLCTLALVAGCAALERKK
jgi:hypothetical protein